MLHVQQYSTALSTFSDRIHYLDLAVISKHSRQAGFTFSCRIELYSLLLVMEIINTEVQLQSVNTQSCSMLNAGVVVTLKTVDRLNKTSVPSV